MVAVGEESPLEAQLPSPKRPLGESAQPNLPALQEEPSESPSKKARRPSRSTRASTTSNLAPPQLQAAEAEAAKAGKPSKLKMLRMWNSGKKKTEEFTDLSRADSSFEQSTRSSTSDALPAGAPEPTPLARRTRAGRAAAAR